LIDPGNRRSNGLAVRFILQFRRYALPFRAPVRTAHGPWSVREGVLVRLEDPATGRVGWGEAAPVPGFGPETAAADAVALGTLGNVIEPGTCEQVPADLPCLQNALATALGEAAPGEGRLELPRYLPVASLLPAGKTALDLVPGRAEVGFRTFKWKVGVGDPNEELGLLDDLCALLPEGAKLRLDANGAWDRRTAERWLERCAERPVEFVEQVAFAGANADERARSREQDLMLGLAADYPTPLALDESLAGDGDLERWIGAGWQGIFVLKPALHGDLARALARLEKAGAAVVFSSALETAVGARAGLRAAFAWQGKNAAGAAPPRQKPRALGFGVWPLFGDARFEGPVAAPLLYREDIEHLHPEAAWNALT
jgi:O-succinylbenzoate synthase